MASIQKLKALIIELREDAEVAADCGHHYENLDAAADALGEFIRLLENPPGTTELALLRMGYARATAVRDQLKAENEELRNAFRPLLAHWDDFKAGESLNVDAARVAMGKGEQS